MESENFHAQWMPKSFNDGWKYSVQINRDNINKNLCTFLSETYKHSSSKEWTKRLNNGELEVNKKIAKANQIIHSGDLICWNRPPWEEPGVPSSWEVIFDNGDVLVINKPSGLPVIAGGGFLKHTLTEMLKVESLKVGNLSPKPIHRLGRFTSGLLVCARRKETRSHLSKAINPTDTSSKKCIKIYRALVKSSNILDLNQSIHIRTPIMKNPHALLGEIWNIETDLAYDLDIKKNNSKRSLTQVKLIERKQHASLIEVTITTGRPHQIRIHMSSIGMPLIGDKLYIHKGKACESARPGQGGFFLHAHKLLKVSINNTSHSFSASLPSKLRMHNE